MRFLPLLVLLGLASPVPASAPPVGLKGDTSCQYGAADCNVCAPTVEKQFRALKLRGSRIAYSYGRGDRLPPFNIQMERMTLRSHVQGFGRLPGVGEENWVALTRSNLEDTSGASGLLLAELRGVKGNGGEPFAQAKHAAPGQLYYYPFHGTDHVSGLQPFGRLLAIATECSKAEACRTRPATVEFMDVTDPARAGLVAKFEIDGSHGEPGINPTHARAAFASATRLADGRTLVFVGGGGTRTGWVYVSAGAELGPATRWKFLHYFKQGEVSGPWDGNFQNMAFVNECGTGKIFLVGLGNRKPLKREFALYEVEDVETFRLRQLVEHTLPLGHRRACNPDGGSGVHVTPEGRLVVYCAGKRGAILGKHHRFTEFTAP